MKTLEKIDITAIKKCTTMLFRMNNGECTMELVKQPTMQEREKNPYAQDMTHIVPITGTLKDYSSDRKKADDVKCFAMDSNYDFVYEGAYLMGNILKAGWTVKACWYRGNTSPEMIERGEDGTGLKLEFYNAKDKVMGGLTFQQFRGPKYDTNHIVI